MLGQEEAGLWLASCGCSVSYPTFVSARRLWGPTSPYVFDSFFKRAKRGVESLDEGRLAASASSGDDRAKRRSHLDSRRAGF